MQNLSPNQLNHLNTGLIILSCLIAFIWPFELFLFSYAFLGPLHYLTEISWLHDRNYFAHTKRAGRPWLLLVGVAILIVLSGIALSMQGDGAVNPKWEIAMFYFVFITALSVSLKVNRFIQVLLASVTLVLLFTLSDWRYYAVIAFLLITIIHVFIFTGAFILYGALKSRSLSAFLSLGAFFVCALSFFIFVPDAQGYTVSEYVRGSYRSFNALNAELIKLFHLGSGTSAREIYESSAGISVMRFIAFAYTYHYLNWFSKTPIIKWHESARRRAGWIITGWLAAIGLYAYNYETGMTLLYSLSILHVMLEFPLNHQSFAGIARELYNGRRPTVLSPQGFPPTAGSGKKKGERLRTNKA